MDRSIETVEMEIAEEISAKYAICHEVKVRFQGELSYFSEPDQNGRIKLVCSSGDNREIIAAYEENYIQTVEGWVYESRAPLIINDTTRDPRFLVEGGGKIPPCSILAFPLLIKDKITGVVSVHRGSDTPFGNDSIKEIHDFARWAGRIIVQSLQVKKNAVIEKRLRAIEKIAGLITSTKTIEAAESVISTGIKELDISCEFTIFSDKSGQAGLPENIRKVLSRKSPQIISKIGDNDVLIAPVVYRENTLGFIRFTGSSLDDYSDLLETLGSILGADVHRLRQEEELEINRSKIKTLQAIADFETSGVLFYSSELSDILDATMEIIIHLLKVERLNIMLYDQESGLLKTQAYWGVDEMPFGRDVLKIGEGIAGKAMESGKPCQKQLEPDTAFIGSPVGQPEIKSLLAYPMIIEGRKIGVINVGSIYNDRLFTDDDIRMISLVVSRAALAIDNSRLIREHKALIHDVSEKNYELERKTADLTERGKRLSITTRRLKESLQELENTSSRLSDLYRFTKEISTSLDPDLIMENALTQIMEIISRPTRILAITIFDESMGQYKIRASRGLSLRYSQLLEFHPVDVPENLIESLSKQKKSYIVSKVKSSPDMSNIRMMKGLNSFYAFPLHNEQQTFGALILASTRENALTDSDIEFLSTISSQVSLALNNAQNYEELKSRTEKLTLLNSMTSDISSLSATGDRLRTLLKLTCVVLEHNFAILLLYNRWGHLEVRFRYNETSKFEDHMDNSEIRGIIDEVVSRNLIYYSSSDFEDLLKRYSLLKKTGIKSLVILPLQFKDKKIGAVVLGDEQPKLHTKQMIEFYRLLAARLSLAIDNALLFSKILLEKNRMESVFESMNEGVASIDWERKITDFNRAAEEITGWKAEEIIGKPCYKIFNCIDSIDGDRCHDQCPLVDILAFEEQKGRRNEGKITTKDNGRRDVSITASLLTQGSDPVGGVLVFHDITDEKAFQERRSDYLATISHDIFTPLTAIKGYVSTLLTHRDKFDSSTQQEFVKIINSEIDRITRLLYNLMSLSRMETDRLVSLPRKQDLGKISDRIAELYSLTTQKHKILVDPSLKEVPLVYADSDQLEQILNNLLSNAIKYSPGGGNIELSAQKDGEFVKISVRDHGIGIDEENLDKVFDRYQREVKKDTRLVSGMGLGLFITKALIKMQGGSISAENCPDGGTRFTFTLPVYDEEKHKEEKGKVVVVRS